MANGTVAASQLEMLTLSGTGVITIVPPNTNTNRTLTLPDAAGTVVSTGSTAVVTPAMLTQTLTSGTAVASTSGTSIDFTGIPTWVKRVTIIFNSVSTNGTSAVQVQAGSGSATTSGYVSTTGNVYGTNLTAVASSSAGFIMQFASAGSTRNGQMVLTNVSSNIWIAAHMMGYNSGQGGCVGGGSISLAGALDRVRITTVNGTDAFDGGSLNILYE